MEISILPSAAFAGYDTIASTPGICSLIEVASLAPNLEPSRLVFIRFDVLASSEDAEFSEFSRVRVTS